MSEVINDVVLEAGGAALEGIDQADTSIVEMHVSPAMSNGTKMKYFGIGTLIGIGGTIAFNLLYGIHKAKKELKAEKEQEDVVAEETETEE